MSAPSGQKLQCISFEAQCILYCWGKAAEWIFKGIIREAISALNGRRRVSKMKRILTFCVRALAMTGPTMPGMVAKVLVIPSSIPAYL